MAGRRGCRRHQALLRGIERALEPRRQCAARPRRAPRRPHPAHARQRRAAMGMHAGGDEARRGDRAGDRAAHPQRSRRPFRPRRRSPRHHQLGSRRQIRRPAGRLYADRRRQRGAGLGVVRKRLRSVRRIHARRRNAGGRSDAALFYLGHHGDAKTRAAQSPELSGRPSVDHLLDRTETRRYPSQYLFARLGQACLELLFLTVERASDDLHRQSAPLQRQGFARHHRALRRHHVLRAADGVAHAHPRGPQRLDHAHARIDRRRRAAQSGSHRAGQGGVGHHHPRRLWPDRNHGAHRQFTGPDREAGFDGAAAAGLSGGAARCERQRARGRRDLPGARAAADRTDARLSGRRRRHARRWTARSIAPATSLRSTTTAT